MNSGNISDINSSGSIADLLRLEIVVIYLSMSFRILYMAEMLTSPKRTFKALVNLGWWPLWHLSL